MKASQKVVLISGGGSGIGLALARAFLNAGSKVIICSRNSQKLQRLRDHTPDMDTFTCDVTNDEQIKSLLDHCEKEYRGIDILINNAGMMTSFDYNNGEISVEHQMNEVNLNFSSPIKMTQYFLPSLLQKEESAIINVSSGLAFVPLASSPVYSASKAALHSWTQSLRWQLKKSSIKVFELMPPLVDTEMVNGKEFSSSGKMSPEKLAIIFMKAFYKNKFEVAPGQASLLRFMSRFVPKTVFKQLNKRLSHR